MATAKAKAKAKAKPKAKADGKRVTARTQVATGKVKAKVKAKAKPVPRVVARAKPTPKAVAKPKAKPAHKPVPKAYAKPAPKPKPKPKLVAKPVIRVAARTTVHVTPPTAHKGVTKATPKAPQKAETRIPGLLTEAELTKQPKADYMSAVQRKFFKHRLIELQTQMRDNADATTEHLRELAVAPDPADRATQEEEHALELRTRDRERKLLKKIEAALLRIEDGSYGYCEETGDPIGVPRLLARPTATLTIEAQERRELKQKMYGE